MSLWKLLKRLFSGTRDPEPKPAARAEARPRPPGNPFPESAPAVIVHREEVIDGRPGIAGYVFRAARPRPGAPLSPLDRLAALSEDHVAEFAQRRLALIPLAVEDWLAADFRPLIAPHAVLLIAPPTDFTDAPAWLAQVQAIRQAGARVGLEHGTIARIPEATASADWVTLELKACPFDDFERLTQWFLAEHPRLALAVTGVSSWAEHRLCQVLGARYSIGDFATRPDEDMPRDSLGQSRLVLMEMLNLLRRDAPSTELAAVAKRDPGVVAKIVEMANSPLSGLSEPVAGLDQALMVLGREVLYRWMAMGLFRANGGKRDALLLEIALRRARFLEVIGSGSLPKLQCDELFLVGMFSVFDSLLGLPLEAVIERIHLPRAVVEVLLSNAGPYGRYLSLALAMEKGHGAQIAKLAETLKLPLATLRAADIEALAWADAALRAG